MDLEKIWIETRVRKSSVRDRIKSFFWCVSHPVLTARLAHFAVKILGKKVLHPSSLDRVCWHCGGAGEKVKIGEMCAVSITGFCYEGCEHMLSPPTEEPWPPCDSRGDAKCAILLHECYHCTLPGGLGHPRPCASCAASADDPMEEYKRKMAAFDGEQQASLISPGEPREGK